MVRGAESTQAAIPMLWNRDHYWPGSGSWRQMAAIATICCHDRLRSQHVERFGGRDRHSRRYDPQQRHGTLVIAIPERWMRCQSVRPFGPARRSRSATASARIFCGCGSRRLGLTPPARGAYRITGPSWRTPTCVTLQTLRHQGNNAARRTRGTFPRSPHRRVAALSP